MSITRRKGVAIVDTSRGILVVAGRSKRFTLSGGGAEKWESRKKATIRELYEETGLQTKRITYLFRYNGRKWHGHDGKSIINHTKVFLVEAYGIPRPRNEIKHIAFWTPDSNIKITTGTQKIINRYIEMKHGK
ncbi:NUDIX domain-containing protein [Candidatus Pacearchaeota archaeon]|nr:NUDIX domain-containing protein [Candidatus Pacearchaeota archaeon]